MKPSTFIALVTGMAAGAALGALFAPDKGEENRKKVKKAAEDLLNKIKEKTLEHSGNQAFKHSNE